MVDEKDVGGFWFPDRIMCLRVSLGARVIYAIFWTRRNVNPCQRQLAKKIGCDERAIRRYIDELVAASLLEVQRRPGKSHTYRVRSISGSALPNPHQNGTSQNGTSQNGTSQNGTSQNGATKMEGASKILDLKILDPDLILEEKISSSEKIFEEEDRRSSSDLRSSSEIQDLHSRLDPQFDSQKQPQRPPAKKPVALSPSQATLSLPFENNKPDEEPEPDKTEDEVDPLSPEGLVKGWNEVCAPAGLAAVKELTASRRKHLLKRLREQPEFDFWNTVLGDIRDSEFMRGSGGRNWKASFDWLIANDTNALKVFEGSLK